MPTEYDIYFAFYTWAKAYSIDLYPCTAKEIEDYRELFTEAIFLTALRA